MGSKANPTTKVQQQDMPVAQATKHLTNVLFKVDEDYGTEYYVYPYTMHEHMGEFVHNIIEQVKALFQSNFFMA